MSLSCHYSWHCSHCLVCKSILSTYPMPFILEGFPHSTMSFSNSYSQHPMPLITYFIFLIYLMPFDNGVLSTSNAIYTERVSSQYVLFKYPQWVFPHWVSYSRHPMLLSDTRVQAICFSWQSDSLNSLPHLVF